jgi:hypothetical protein
MVNGLRPSILLEAREMAASKLEMISAHSELAFYGCTQAREFFAKEDSEEFFELSQEILKITFGANFDEPSLAPFGMRIPLARVEHTLRQSHPILLARYIRALQKIEDQTRRFFGNGWMLAQGRSRFRSLDSNQAKKWCFHSPGPGEPKRHGIVLWIPLNKALGGVSIDIVGGSHTVISLADAKYRQIYSSPPFVAALGRPYSPVLDPGDIIACDQFTLYRASASQDSAGFACELAFTWRLGQSRMQRAVRQARKIANKPFAIVGGRFNPTAAKTGSL